jgi:hypothetical protein
MLDAIKASGSPVVAVWPIIGGQAVKGPTAKMMRELGLEVSAAACEHARLYLGNRSQDGEHRRSHSDKEKFCNGLKGPKSWKMSEWSLKPSRNPATSKLNTNEAFQSVRLS